MMFETSSLIEWAAGLANVSTAAGLIVRAITKEAMNKIALLADKHDDLKHQIKNQTARIDAVEHLQTADVERIVKLESAVQAIDKAMERVERGQDKLTDIVNDRFDTLADAIRKA
ncbi:hypothetical protein [uncultured Sphingomonas sp.]|uniref:hypothetical protein n=1 Tax=uncultured Sphingomonas sp. TaxID=158754 RepID=UPI002600C6C4|nr:hypothetical protein [uncultured Sphingomonas sp.]